MSPAMLLQRSAISSLAVLSAITAHADVLISSDATQNMSCHASVCSPTASDAVLNAGDLETMLGSGNVKVTTTGSGVQADNIRFKAPVSWSNTNTLALDAYESIRVGRRVSVESSGGLSIVTDRGGSGGMLSFGSRGSVSFESLSSPLTINGAAYTLVHSIAALASAVAANPSGDYALARDYDASKDGTRYGTPVKTTVTGNIQGLGNTISNIRVVTKGGISVGGLFWEIARGGTLENLALANISIKAGHGRYGISFDVGGLLQSNEGVLFGDHVGGKISVNSKNSEGCSDVGGLVGDNSGTIANSYSTADVYTDGGCPGGLVGDNDFGTITESWATGSVTGVYEGEPTYVGGLAAYDDDAGTSNSYATGSVDGGGALPDVGGFIGGSAGTEENISASYSTGRVSGSGLLGGFSGTGSACTDCYWDTTTSGTDNGEGYGNESGITGLTTKQLRSGLPTGFDPTIWAEKKGVNHGFPYLIANPPPNAPDADDDDE